MTDSRSDMVARVNSVRVLADDLSRVAERIEALPSESRGGEALFYVAAELFKPDAYRAFAVCERFHALMTLLNSGALPQSLVPVADDGGLLVSDDLLAVAAQEPLLFRGETSMFNAESFLSAFLKIAHADGRA